MEVVAFAEKGGNSWSLGDSRCNDLDRVTTGIVCITLICGGNGCGACCQRRVDIARLHRPIERRISKHRRTIHEFDAASPASKYSLQ